MGLCVVTFLVLGGAWILLFTLLGCGLLRGLFSAFNRRKPNNVVPFDGGGHVTVKRSGDAA